MARLLVLAAAVAVLGACAALALPVEERRLIAFSETERVWMTEEEIFDLIRKDIRFMDITEHPNENRQGAPKANLAFPAGPTHQTQVRSFNEDIDLKLFEENLTKLSSFYTRYYKSTTGVESSNWVFATATAYAANRSDITVSRFAHANYNQNSVIVRIEGTAGNAAPAVILGAHQDSINSGNPTGGRSPGADDDGSGTITLLEVLRILVLNGFKPYYPIEFQWYAAEEVGLLGSQDIAATYKRQGRAVYGMFQIDMSGYYDANNFRVRVLNDFVDADLTTFTKTLIDEYTDFERRDYSCGYACSDHASYYRSGYPSASTFEGRTNPQIHTSTDDLPLIKYDHIFGFIQLGVAYAVELSYGA